MAKSALKDVPIFYREEETRVRKYRFSLKPVRLSQGKESKESDSINISVNPGKSRTGSVQIDSEETKKIQLHLDASIKKIQRIHKSLLWNIYVGRSYVDKSQPNTSCIPEEKNVDSFEGQPFEASNPATWSQNSLEQVWRTLKAAEMSTDGVVVLFVLPTHPEVDADEAAWEIQKVMIYHLIKTDLHRNINEESCMVRQNLDPVSRKVRTPGRLHEGFMVYLSYQLLDTVSFNQIIGETILYSSDIRMKKKQLMNSIGDNRFPPPVEEKVKKLLDQVREWMSRDQVELIRRLSSIKDPEEIKVVGELLHLVEGSAKQRSGLGLPQFISFLSHQDQPQMTRSSSKLSVTSVKSRKSSAPSMSTRGVSAGGGSNSSNLSSCSSTPDTPRRVSVCSQNSSDSHTSSRRSSTIVRRRSQLESIQSDSDSVPSAAETLVDTRESSSRIRRENAIKTGRAGGKVVQRTVSLNAKQNGSGPRLQRTLSEKRTKGEKEGSSKEDIVNDVPSVTDSTIKLLTMEDDRDVLTSVKISRQVKLNNSVGGRSPRGSPVVDRNKSSTPTNRRI